jgi:hypothetical protein
MVSLSAHLPYQLGSGTSVANQKNVAHEIAAPPPTVYELSRSVAPEKGDHSGKRKRDNDVPSSHVGVRRPGERAYGRYDRDRRHEHTSKLLSPDGEEAGFITTRGPHGDEPQYRQANA